MEGALKRETLEQLSVRVQENKECEDELINTCSLQKEDFTRLYTFVCDRVESTMCMVTL